MTKIHAKKSILILLACFIVMSPVLYLLNRREYDLGQIYVPQTFDSSRYKTVMTNMSNVSQTFTAESHNLIGFDLRTENCALPDPTYSVEIQDLNGTTLRKARRAKNILSNHCDIIKFRFDPIEDSFQEVYTVHFPKSQQFQAKLRYSLEDYYPGGHLIIDTHIKDGDIPLTPVYREDNIFDYVSLIYRRIATLNFSQGYR